MRTPIREYSAFRSVVDASAAVLEKGASYGLTDRYGRVRQETGEGGTAVTTGRGESFWAYDSLGGPGQMDREGSSSPWGETIRAG